MQKNNISMLGMRINQTWLKTSYCGRILKNRLKRYPKQALDYYSIDWNEEKTTFNEEGC